MMSHDDSLIKSIMHQHSAEVIWSSNQQSKFWTKFIFVFETFNDARLKTPSKYES